MKKYVALLYFKDRATGLDIEAGAPYPPGDRIVSEQWIEYLASDKNATGSAVIAPVGEEPKQVEPQEPTPVVEEKVTEPEPEITPLIDDTPVPKKKEPVKTANPFTPSPSAKKDPFEGLTAKGIRDAFVVLNHGIDGPAPETKDECIAYLNGVGWKKKNLAKKQKLLKAFGVSGANKFRADAVDSTLRDLLTKAIEAKMKG